MEVGILNMVSRIGKQSSQKHMVLKHKEEILLGARKKFVVKNQTMDMKGSDQTSYKDLQKIIEEEKQRLKEDQIKNKTISHVFANQSREQYYAANSMKDTFPDMCHYNVSYTRVKKRIPEIDFTMRPKTKAKVKKVIKNPHDVVLNPKKQYFEQPKVIQFDKQLQRNSARSLDPHESRFKSWNLWPSVWSRTQKQKSPILEKQLPRTSKIAREIEQPSYNPNYEYTKKSLGKVGPSFNKLKGRSASQRELEEKPEFYDVKFQVLHKKIPSLTFDKQLGRLNLKSQAPNSKPQSPLPTFMTRVGSRCGSGVTNFKSLEMNCFSTGQFQSITSSFANPLKNKKLVVACNPDPLDVSFMQYVNFTQGVDDPFI